MTNGSKTILLDSNIAIYLSQGKLSIDKVFEEHEIYAISIVTYMEMLSYNFQNKQEESFVKKLLNLFEIIDIDRDIANRVIALKKIRKIKLPDAIIASTALHRNLVLYTNDKHFHTIDGLKTKYFDIH